MNFKNELDKLIRVSLNFKKEEIEVYDITGCLLFTKAVGSNETMDHYEELDGYGELDILIAKEYETDIKNTINKEFLENKIINLDQSDLDNYNAYKVRFSYSSEYYYVLADSDHVALEEAVAYLVDNNIGGELSTRDELLKHGYNEDEIDNNFTPFDISPYVEKEYDDYVRYSDYIECTEICQCKECLSK